MKYYNLVLQKNIMIQKCLLKKMCSYIEATHILSSHIGFSTLQRRKETCTISHFLGQFKLCMMSLLKEHVPGKCYNSVQEKIFYRFT